MTAKTKTKTAKASATTVITPELATLVVKESNKISEFSNFVKFVKDDNNIVWQVQLPIRFVTAKKIVKNSVITIEASALKQAFKYDRDTKEASTTEVEPITYGFMGKDENGNPTEWVSMPYGQGTFDRELFLKGFVNAEAGKVETNDARPTIRLTK
jgi:hypothetical protein